MKPETAVIEHERALQKDPGNVNIRLKLASALRQAGRTEEAVQMYLSVARAYQGLGHLGPAAAACKTARELDPRSKDAVVLLKELVLAARAAGGQSPAGASMAKAKAAGLEFRKPSKPSLNDEQAARGHVLSANPHQGVAAQVSFRRPPRARKVTEAGAPSAQLHSSDSGGISPRLPQALAEIAAGMSLKHFPSGSMIVREGDPGNALYLIVTGKVRVLKHDPNNPGGDLLEVAQLGDGEIFGEFALLADFRRHATVQAIEDSHVYAIPRSLVSELTGTYPELAAHLETFYRERLLNSLLNTSSFLQALDGDERREILKKFETVRVGPETFVVAEGEPAVAFFVVLLGSVDLLKSVGEGRAHVVATLSEGNHFGTSALLSGDVAPGSVMSRGPTELAMLPAEDFYRVVAKNPLLWELLRQENDERLTLFQDYGE